MRFDDRLETMLARDLSAPTAATATWTQVADLLAQEGRAMAPEAAARGLAALAVLRSSVPVDVRAASVRGLASRCRFAPLAVLFASEPAQIAAPLFDRLRLDEQDWLAILPDLGPLARSRLRGRSDLPAPVLRALTDFGSTDFALSGAVHDGASLAELAPPTVDHVLQEPDLPEPDLPEPAQAAEATSDIAQLVRRIENWRQRKPGDAPYALHDDDAPDDDAPDDPSQAIGFACDTDGLVRAIHGLPRGAFVGVSLARAAEPGDAGVDAGVSRAFDKRAPIRQGRMALAPGNPWSGLWMIDADPAFDHASGRFTGYRGTLTLADDAVAAPAPAVEAHHPDTIRQMLHELRSPLNAISGFSQLIDGQYFGPVPTLYQTLNRAILRDAARLNTGIEDLALAAELDADSYRPHRGETILADALTAFADSHDGITIGDTGIDAVVPIDAADLATLLDRVRRALDPEESAPVDIDILPDRAGSGWQIILSLAAPLVGGGSEAARQAARSLAERLAATHGGLLKIVDNSASLNLPRLTMLAEAAR